MSNFLISPLAELRHHWGDPYEISGLAGHWRAARRDDGTALTAGSSEGLRQAIITDYFAKPVPREFDRLPALLPEGSRGKRGRVQGASRVKRPTTPLRAVPLPPWEQAYQPTRFLKKACPL
jgi:hypothetical protein